MLVNAKIVLNDGRVRYFFFKNVEAMVSWMKQNHGKYRAVETDFLNPITIDERKMPVW